jgi:transposase
MLQLNISEVELKEIEYQRYQHPHPRVQRKMEALYLKAKGLPHHQIAELVGICDNTLRDYFEQYQQGGVAALTQLNFYRPTSQLQDHKESLEAYFLAHPPNSIPQAVAKIEELTGLVRSPTQVGIFLKKLGFKRLKTYSVPAKFDQQQQTDFKKKN